MKFIAVFLSLFISTLTIAQKNNIVIGSIDSVQSAILKEKRKIWVHVPDDSSPDGVFAKKHFPVVYVLDGDVNFCSVVGIVQQLGGGGGNTSFPQLIVVGIPNMDRTRDLTPSHVSTAPMLDSVSISHTGGGERFISFLEKELFPHMDSLYPTAPYRLLIGHSFGGLMAIHSLVNHPGLFNAYIAIDPSMFWDDQKLLKQALSVVDKRSFEGKSLFLAAANTMENGMDTIQVKQDTNFTSLHIRSIMQLGHSLSANKQNRLSFKWKYYPEYNHGSVPLVAEYDALRFIFSFYNFNLPFAEFFKSSYQGDTLMAAHYKKISKQMGYKVSPPEQLVNVLGYQLMDSKQFNRAIYFFQMNIDNYPQSFNAYDSMGDWYLKTGDKQKAKVFYLMSLKLTDSAETRRKLEKL